jgi:aspartate oxidase
MTTKSKEKAAQGASTQKKKEANVLVVKPGIKPSSNGAANKPSKEEQVNQHLAKLNDITKLVRDRSILLRHKTKLDKLLQAPELVNALNDDEPNKTEQVAEIVIKSSADDRYSEGYKIANNYLATEVLKLLKGNISTKLEEIENELLV